jgi:hypothetical protein
MVYHRIFLVSRARFFSQAPEIAWQRELPKFL